MTTQHEHLLRDLAPQVLGAIVRRFRDFAAAEDAVQEALLAATLQWPSEGLPDNPRGWLIHVAARRMSDLLRQDVARRRRETSVMAALPDTAHVSPALDSGEVIEHDDALILLFMCCHASLTPPSAVALTLRAVGGLTTAEIANAFLVPEATMAQRISRSKQRIKASGVTFDMPPSDARAERLSSVLHVLYLIFNEGYASSTGAELIRTDLSAEAIRLARRLHAALPADVEAAGLLALMLLTDARRRARSGPNGELIPLDEQDRALWDRAVIDEGTSILTRALSRGTPGPYQLQAAIAAVHDEAARAEDTDWPQILALYTLLLRATDNPMVALNHAVASGMVYGPDAGLALLDRLRQDDRVAGHYRVEAVRAHLLERRGDRASAIAAYRHAADGTASTPERNYLLLKAGRLAGSQATAGSQVCQGDADTSTGVAPLATRRPM
jgi:RNA polymerase sigma factor (sigma-70 family)